MTNVIIMDHIKAKSVQQGDCIVWQGGKVKGYGKIRYHGMKWRIHRLVYILTYGETELDICHTCDNRACWNIEHLFAGTNDDNMQDKSAKGRVNAPFGESHYNAKLNEKQVQEIKNRYRPYVITQNVLAKEYGVSTQTIWNILHGYNWSYLS